MEIRIKRAYEPASDEDGTRILVDRLWPRGISRDRARIDAWLRDLAPSNELRRWYHADRAKWDEFRARYRDELDSNADVIARLNGYLETGPVTFVYASREPERNNAFVLKEYVRSRDLPGTDT